MSSKRTKNIFPAKGAAARPKARPPRSAGAASPKLPAVTDSRWTIFLVCVFLAAIVWIVFGQTLHFGFINFDDNLYVYENDKIVHGLSWRGIGWIFTHSVSSNWHPLTLFSHMLDCQFYALNAGGHHLTNVLLHAASAILLFLMLREMTAALWRSAFVAVVFAVQPLHVESVAWIAERKDVLSGLFFMLTLWAYLRYVRQSSWRRYLVVLLAFALGLMSKPMLVTLPFVLLLLDYWPLRRFANPDHAPEIFSIPRHLILEKIPLLALAAAACAAAVLSQHEVIAANESLPFALRIQNAALSCVVYLKQIFYPAKLAVFYPLQTNGIQIWKSLVAVLLLAAISGGVFGWRKKHPYLIVGWLWYLGMLVPVIGLVQVGEQAHADRYTYLPQIGLCLMLAWLVADLSVRLRRRFLVLGGLSAIIFAALIFCARAQTSYWKDSETLWTHTLACTSNNDVAHNNLGVTLAQNGQMDEGIAHLRAALAINPDYAEAFCNLAYALFQKGQTDEAVTYFEKALAINPDYAEAHDHFGNALLQKGQTDEAVSHYQMAIAIQPDYAEAHNDLGNALIQKNQTVEAIAQYQTAIAIKPGFAEAHNNLGNALLLKGQTDAAITQYQTAIDIRPDYARARRNLGVALVQKGQTGAAIEQFQKALAVQPDLVQAQEDLARIAWTLATSPDSTLRNGNKAVELSRQTDQLSGGQNPMMAATLAAAYAEAGRFPEAIATAQRALQLATEQKDFALGAALQEEIQSYEIRAPWREVQP